MLKRIIALTFLSGTMLLSAPQAGFADGRHRGGDDRRSGHDNNGRDRHNNGRDRHNNGRDRHDYDRHDRGRDRDDYSRRYGYDRGYYDYYGSGCNGYRDGYYYGPDGRPYSRDGRPYYRRNGDCDNYYQNNGTYYGSPYCDRYDYQSGYCG